MHTQVGIIGAGPAGLMLAHLLHACGIECVVLETKSRSYLEGRIRAGVLEQGTVDLLDRIGCGARMHSEGLLHHGIEIGYNRRRYRIDLGELTGKAVMVYGQHEVVKDLIAHAHQLGIPLHFEVEKTAVHGIDSDSPSITYNMSGTEHTLTCDFIAGCDGFHGISRPAVPGGMLRTYEKVFPYSWLGILVEAAPSNEELVYMHSPHGFALFSMRSPSVTRLYLQCENSEDLSMWSDDRIWMELQRRFECGDGWQPNQGRIVQKSITPMRSFVTEPMQYGRLFLAGDAVHIVPPTGAKGMNLAISDVKILSDGFDAFYRKNGRGPLDRYSAVSLRRIWKAQRFSHSMTTMLHRDPEASEFDDRRQTAELDYATSSRAAALAISENYVGLPIESVESGQGV